MKPAMTATPTTATAAASAALLRAAVMGFKTRVSLAMMAIKSTPTHAVMVVRSHAAVMD